MTTSTGSRGRPDGECVVVGRPAVLATNEPRPPTPRAVVFYVLPGRGTAFLGAADGPCDVRDVVGDAVLARSPDAIWLRHRSWFVAEWGRRPTDEVAASLAALADAASAEFVGYGAALRSST